MTPRILITVTANGGTTANPAVIHAVTHPLVSDADCSVEAIAMRANYVGPVLEGILHDMETHWDEGEDLDI